MHKPRFLILDEPTVGLDPTQIVEIRALIKRLAAESAILFSSHILSEVEAICDRVIIIINGQVKADQRLSDLAAGGQATLVLQDAPDGIGAALEAQAGITDFRRVASRDGYPAWQVSGADEIAPQLYRLARDNDWQVREIRRDSVTLEAFFNQLATSAWGGGR